MAGLHPLVRLSLYLAVMAASSTVLAQRDQGHRRPLPEPRRAPAGLDQVRCPPGTLDDAGVCIPVPHPDVAEGEALVAERNAHRTRSGAWTEYDQIPRRPDRPRDYALYRYPVEPLPGQSLLMSGYDLNLPSDTQRRGPRLKATGHGGIDLAQRRGAEVRLVFLEHQKGPAEALYVGWLFGNTVVTLHNILEAGTERQYLALHGHLERPASGLEVGTLLDEGGIIGYVGDSDSPGAIHLHLELRQIRSGVDARLLAPSEIVDNARTVACDPRNLLPLQAFP
jgi:murein DD-endopeptidase MepM/ murein hydrolase activator NlpD